MHALLSQLLLQLTWPTYTCVDTSEYLIQEGIHFACEAHANILALSWLLGTTFLLLFISQYLNKSILNIPPPLNTHVQPFSLYSSIGSFPSFVIGRRNIPFRLRTSTNLTLPSASGYTSVTRPNVHCVGGKLSVLITTMSST